MLTELRNALRPALVVLLAMTVLTGIAYPLLVTWLAQLLVPHAANGGLIRSNGRVIGSELIGQSFASPRYFHGRPSAAGKAGYDAANSGATNLGPGSKDLRDAIAARVVKLRAEGVTGAIPADLVTSSASGLDPDISPAAAQVQVPRVAAARRLDRAAVAMLVARQVQHPLAGFLGEARVNVLDLNRELDRISPAPS